MGGGLSIHQSNYQVTSNKISQVSNEECINYCTNLTNINVNLNNVHVGLAKIGGACFVDSPSCVLKSSLDTELINKLSNTQSASIADLTGLFSFLNNLTSAGDDINQSNYQGITNEATQQMNSLCLNTSTVGGTITYIANGGSIRELDLGKTGHTTKSDCVIDNMSRFYAQNDETNDQSAKITRMSMIILIIIFVLIIIVVLHSLKHKKHKSKSKDLLSEL